jgi:hypothetical protein
MVRETSCTQSSLGLRMTRRTSRERKGRAEGLSREELGLILEVTRDLGDQRV